MGRMNLADMPKLMYSSTIYDITVQAKASHNAEFRTLETTSYIFFSFETALTRGHDVPRELEKP